MLIYLFILCLYLILSVLIAMGDGKQFPRPESEIRFCWGMSYNCIGQLHHNLNKYDVVVGLEIPDFRTVSYYTPFFTDQQYHKKWDDTFNVNNWVLYETCNKVWPAYLATITTLDHPRERIKHIMDKEIPAVIRNFELKPIEPEPTTATAYPEPRTKAYIETKSIAYPNTRRKKRFIADLISLGIQGFTAFNTNRKQNQLKRGMKMLFDRQHKLENKELNWKRR